MASGSIYCLMSSQALVLFIFAVIVIYIAIMLIERIVIIVVLSVVLKKADGISFSQDATFYPRVEFEQVTRPCCVIGDRSFLLLESALYSFTNNTIIKIIGSNAALDTKISLENLENVSIIGHGTPTVNCNGIGAI